MDNEAAMELVAIGNTQFYVEVQGTTGPEPMGVTDVLSFDGVRDAVEAIASQFAEVWTRVQPDEASVQFAVKLVAKSGKLTALIVEGGGEATLTVSMRWSSSATRDSR